MRVKDCHFTIAQGQMRISGIRLPSSGPEHVVFEAETEEKCPEVKSYSGSEIIIGPSSNTHPGRLDPNRPAWTRLFFPEQLYGWQVAGFRFDHYLITVSLIMRDLGKAATGEAWRATRSPKAQAMTTDLTSDRGTA